MRDPRFDILFEPVAIGPKIARNRFYQVPHCNGLGWREPRALAAMRAAKAEGGWAVVCTEEVEVHPASEVSPSIEGRLWSSDDIPAHALVVDAIHAHGALAGIELVYNAPRPNHISRIPPAGVQSAPVIADSLEPTWCRAMDAGDIRDVVRRCAAAARRAREAGYDLIYCYAGHGLTLAQHFLSRHTNDRTDSYGGSLENRARFLKELICATRDAIGPDCALPVRIAVDDGATGLERAEIEDVIAMLDPLVDLWDFCMSSWPADSQTARFADEGYQDDFVRGLKALSARPVVGVGRFTSPETMRTQVRSGALDFVGAARPSIADPLLPNKIAEGRLDDIRECIGCNICVASDVQGIPIRCTQNPSMGEEWRRGWRAEALRPKTSEARVLVVGAGPAGLEAALGLGRRGYQVLLAEKERALGGRARREARLPGLSTYARVADWRETQIAKLGAIEVFRGSPLGADDIIELAAQHVVIAAGAAWRRDGRGRAHPRGLPIAAEARVLTPDDVLDGATPAGDVLVYDDDHGHLAGAIAEHLARSGARVTFATPAPLVSAWTQVTLEQPAIERRLVETGVAIRTRTRLAAIGPTHADLVDDVTGARAALDVSAVVLATGRAPNDALYHALAARRSAGDAPIASLAAIGDACAPSLIANAVFAGRAYAEAFGSTADPDAVPFLRLPVL